MIPEFTKILDAQVEALKKRLADKDREIAELKKLFDFQMKRKPVECTAMMNEGLM